MATVPVPTQVFTEETFGSQFSTDILRACATVHIESAYITVDGVKRFAHTLTQCLRNRVQVCAFIQQPKGWLQRQEPTLDPMVRAELAKTEAAVQLLRSYGAHLSLRHDIHQKIAVIDHQITWSGSLNILSYTRSTREEIYRWTDPAWARQTMQRRKLDRCTECIQKAGQSCIESSPLVDMGTIGRQIASRRAAIGMSQGDLADAVGARRETICEIECGKRHPRADLLIRIYQKLGMQLMAVPPDAVSMIERWMALNK